MLSERDIESLSSLLAALLVAEWRSRHSMVKSVDGQWPPVLTESRCDAESCSCGLDAHGHESTCKLITKAKGSLKLVDGPKNVVHRTRHST